MVVVVVLGLMNFHLPSDRSGRGWAMFFRRKAPKAQEGAREEAGHLLCLYVAEYGWVATTIDVQTNAVVSDDSGPMGDTKAWTAASLESGIRLAAQKLGRRRLSEIREIRILYDDPAVLYSDSRDHALRSGSPGAIREHGARLLDVAACTYGERHLQQTPHDLDHLGDKDMEFASGEKPQDKVHAFADVASVRNVLSQLDAGALKVTTLTPVGDLLLNQALNLSPGANAVLYVAEFNSYFALANPQYGIAFVRVLPVGMKSLVMAIAEANSISTKEVEDALADRDFISGVQIGLNDGGEDVIAQSPYERTLAPLLTNFMSELSTTVEFFEKHRGGGRVPAIAIYGSLDRIQGLKALISNNLEIPVNFQSSTMIEMFRQCQPQSLINLLNGADGSLLTVGRMEYSFSKDRFISTEELARQTISIKQSNASREQPSRVAALRAGRGANSLARGRGAIRKRQTKEIRGPVAELWAKLTSRETQQVAKRWGQREVATTSKPRNDRQYLMLLGVLVFAVFYVAWMRFDDLAIRHERRVSEFAKLVFDNQRLRDQIARLGIKGLPDQIAVADKVLWSDKFLSLARNLDKAMWLTDVYLSDESRQIGNQTVLSKKLTLEGAVLPSVHGHILKISEYIDRLLKDETYFMGDFREISFEGAHVDASEENHVVRFTIAAWYDENKRVETKSAKPSGGPVPLSDALQNVDKRNVALENVVDKPRAK